MDPAGGVGFPEGLLVLAGFFLPPLPVVSSLFIDIVFSYCPLPSLFLTLFSSLLLSYSPPQTELVKMLIYLFFNLIRTKSVSETKEQSAPRGINKSDCQLSPVLCFSRLLEDMLLTFSSTEETVRANAEHTLPLCIYLALACVFSCVLVIDSVHSPFF